MRHEMSISFICRRYLALLLVGNYQSTSRCDLSPYENGKSA